jgi:hypothetical protein
MAEYAQPMAGGKEGWRQVRARRATPPGLAGEFADRRLVFQAALTQAEELWESAAVAGAAARPLPLFYCLSQAGRAVCAAWTTDAVWRPGAHGLSRRESYAADAVDRTFGYAARVNAPERGSYSMVARATRSPTYEGHATVRELWASLPGWPTPRRSFGDQSRCLTLEPVQHPDDDRPLFQRIAGPTHAAIRFSTLDPAEIPGLYPAAGGMEQHGTTTNLFGGDEPTYRFLDEQGRARPIHEIGVKPYWSEQRLGSDLMLRPKVGEGMKMPSEFLTLWALLFCLSELARYYPDTWVLALDPDASVAATTLEQGLDLALERAPVLINEALGGPISRLVLDELRAREDEAQAVVGEEEANPEVGHGDGAAE